MAAGSRGLPRAAVARCAVRAGALALLLVIAACSDLQVSSRAGDPAFVPGNYAGVRFAAPALAAGSAEARATDRVLRELLEQEFTARGYPLLAGSASGRALLIDYTLTETTGVNADRLDSPGDYQGSWRERRVPDGTGTMDHTVADSTFNARLALRILLLPENTRRVAWEASATRTLAPDHPRGAALRGVLGQMLGKMLDEMPR